MHFKNTILAIIFSIVYDVGKLRSLYYYPNQTGWFVMDLLSYQGHFLTQISQPMTFIFKDSTCVIYDCKLVYLILIDIINFIFSTPLHQTETCTSLRVD